MQNQFYEMQVIKKENESGYERRTLEMDLSPSRSEDRDEARGTHQLPPARSISTQTRQTAVLESQEAL